MPKFNDEWKVQPHGPLTELARGLWTAEGSIQMPLGRFPRRMTIVVLEKGDLAIWSPIALDDAQMARLDALGQIGYLIVPNAGHRLDLRPFKARYPNAKVIAPQGVKKDVQEAIAVDATTNILDDETIALDRVEGTKADEFFMIVSRQDGATLVLNDILSSIRHPKGLGAKVMARLFDFGVDRPRTSRLVKRLYVSDPKAIARQFRSWADIPALNRIIVSHADVIDENPAEVLMKAAEDMDPR